MIVWLAREENSFRMLGDKVNLVLRAAVHFRVALLAAETADLRNRHPVDALLDERILDLIDHLTFLAAQAARQYRAFKCGTIKQFSCPNIAIDFRACRNPHSRRWFRRGSVRGTGS